MIIKYLKYSLLFVLSALALAADQAAADALIAQSREAMAAQDHKQALELARQATVAAPDYAKAFSHLGTAYALRIGEVNFMNQAMMSGQMLGAYEKSVELDRNHISGYIGLARYYSNAPAIAGGSLDKAESYAREVAQRTTGSASTNSRSSRKSAARKQPPRRCFASRWPATRTTAKPRPDWPA